MIILNNGTMDRIILIIMRIVMHVLLLLAILMMIIVNRGVEAERLPAAEISAGWQQRITISNAWASSARRASAARARHPG